VHDIPSYYVRQTRNVITPQLFRAHGTWRQEWGAEIVFLLKISLFHKILA
jgi:hypothetical protein